VIIAGGPGRRLWPASRQDKPKQLIRLIDGKCLLEIALERLSGLFPPELTLVVTSASYSEQVCQCFAPLPAENVIGEPEGRDTANAIALAAEIVAGRAGDDATMAVFTADHVITPAEEFRRCVGLACEVAEKNPASLVTFGIRPKWAHTGLGYIHCGEKLREGVHRVLGFKEKPDHHQARVYYEGGGYFWNSGMFVWRVAAIREAMRRFLPASATALAPISEAVSAGQDISGLLNEIYPRLPKISIDYAVMENAEDVLMVELPCRWLDVGSWPALDDVIKLDDDGNALVANRAALIDSSHNIVYADDDHLVGVVGMDDCIVVHTPDATLVCKKSDSQRLKELVDLIGRRFGPGYL